MNLIKLCTQKQCNNNKNNLSLYYLTDNRILKKSNKSFFTLVNDNLKAKF